MPNITFTDSFRRQRTNDFMKSLNSEDYYIGIGKSEGLLGASPQVGIDDIYSFENAIRSVASMHKLQGGFAAQRVLPIKALRQDERYKGFDPYDLSSFESDANVNGCLTLLDDRFVLLHLGHNTNPISALPSLSQGDTNFRIIQAQGHYYAFVGIVSPLAIGICAQFGDFLPVEQADSSFISSVTKGIFTGFSIKNGGLDYNNPSITFTAYDKNDNVLVQDFNIPSTEIQTDSNGKILNIDLTNFIQSAEFTENIHHVDYAISGNPSEEAVLLPIISPPEGLERQLYDVTPSWRVILSGSFQGHMSADVFPMKPLLIPFSQISILKNPDITNTSQSTMNVLSYIVLDQNANISNFQGTFQPGDIIYQESTGAKAFYDGFATVDAGTQNEHYRVYFHQNLENTVNIVKFDNSSIEINGISYDIDSVERSTLYTPSFDESIIYLENLEEPIVRQENQIDNIQIILTF